MSAKMKWIFSVSLEHWMQKRKMKDKSISINQKALAMKVGNWVTNCEEICQTNIEYANKMMWMELARRFFWHWCADPPKFFKFSPKKPTLCAPLYLVNWKKMIEKELAAWKGKTAISRDSMGFPYFVRWLTDWYNSHRSWLMVMGVATPLLQANNLWH